MRRLGGESRYRRFLTGLNELPAADLDHFVDVDHSDHDAIIAVDRSTGEAVGTARYVRSDDDAEVAEAAEVAVTVIDDRQGRGRGTRLLAPLAARARHEGVRRFSARVLGENSGLRAPQRRRRGPALASASDGSVLTLRPTSAGLGCE